METIGERLNYVRLQKGLTYKQLGEMVGIKEGAVRAGIKNNAIKPYYINVYVEKLQVTKQWLETGEGDWQGREIGDMRSVADYLANEAKAKIYEEKQPEGLDVDYNEVTTMYIPLISQYGYAGYLQGFADPEYIEELPKIPWAVEREYKGEYRFIEAKGDSMDNGDPEEAILEGDRLLCRNVRPEHWRNKLHINQWDFAIVHRERGIVIKRIIKHDVEKGILTLHSLNDYYEDYEISLDDVAQIFNIVDLYRKRRRGRRR